MTAINRTIAINHRQQEVLDDLFHDTELDNWEPHSVMMAVTGEIIAIGWTLREAYEIAADGRYHEIRMKPLA